MGNFMSDRLNLVRLNESSSGGYVYGTLYTFAIHFTRIPYVLKYKFGFKNQEKAIMTNVPLRELTSSDPIDCVKDNEIELAKWLIFTGELKIDDPLSIWNYQTMLHYACALQREEIFDFLVKQGANLDIEDLNGQTPLMKAASVGHLKMVQTLVERGVDPRRRDWDGKQPLDKARLFNNHEVS